MQLMHLTYIHVQCYNVCNDPIWWNDEFHINRIKRVYTSTCVYLHEYKEEHLNIICTCVQYGKLALINALCLSMSSGMCREFGPSHT